MWKEERYLTISRSNGHKYGTFSVLDSQCLKTDSRGDTDVSFPPSQPKAARGRRRGKSGASVMAPAMPSGQAIKLRAHLEKVEHA
jgi:hypothetical protein